MRDYQKELELRTDFIRKLLSESGASGVVYGNSGGKDSALVGILCKRACTDTLGLLLPCQSSRNFGEDMRDAKDVAAQYGIETRTVDLTAAKLSLSSELKNCTALNAQAINNIAPRLRMSALYAVAAAENRLVAGTGNRSEGYMGYFTKWGDGAYDFDPIADLTVREIYEFLRFLKTPESILTKAPSAGLYEGQTDEAELGVSYADIDAYLLDGKSSARTLELIERSHKKSEHKRRMPAVYKPDDTPKV